jgi:hypothetical protein
MKLCDALKLMENEQAAMRRHGWHNGICYAYIDTSKGFVEPFAVQRRNTVTLALPYHPLRADWCTDDWYQLSPSERSAIDAQAANIANEETVERNKPKSAAAKKISTKKRQPRAKAQKA